MSNSTSDDFFVIELWNKFRYGCDNVHPQDCMARGNVILADGGIAGIGTCLGFQISAILSIVLTAILTVIDFRHHHTGPEEVCKRRKFLETVILSLSDSQLITSLAILIAGYNKECALSVYHFNIVNDLVLLSTVTHAFSLLVLPKYFREHPWLATLRAIIILAIGVFAARSAWWARYMVTGRDPDVGWPAACYLNPDLRHQLTVPDATHTNTIGLIFVVLTIFVLIFSLTTASIRVGRIFDRLGRFAWALRICIQGVVPFGTFVFSTWKLWSDRQALSTTSSPVRLMNDDQDRWGFGQLLTMLLLAKVLLTAMEAWPTKKTRRQALELRGIKPNALQYDKVKDTDVDEASNPLTGSTKYPSQVSVSPYQSPYQSHHGSGGFDHRQSSHYGLGMR